MDEARKLRTIIYPLSRDIRNLRTFIANINNTLQADPHFGRILAAYGGVFVAGSLAWGVAVDGFRPDRFDIVGATICLVGVAVIVYAPRPS